MSNKFLAGMVILGVMFMALLMSGVKVKSNANISYSDFLNKLANDEVTEVFIDDGVIYGRTANNVPFKTDTPNDPGLMGDLIEHNVRITAAPKGSALAQILLSWFPILLLIAVWIYYMKRMQGGGRGGALKFGKSKSREFKAGEVKVRFADVAGIEEAKEEVTEIVDFLRNAERFNKVGGRIPRGVLMVGSPGTGKTLLAKAIAGEAEVPFFSISGSDFVEMFVGVGASRVRDLFAEAKKAAPCIVFIDEIDAVGRKRGSGIGGGNDEREQTLNQLLVEMDGFEGTEGIIVIAATNRPDVLDKALLRPGRFDRQVTIPLPDIRGREQILKVHLRKIALGESIDVMQIARGTPGFSGAELANLVNEAALIAARARREEVTMADFEYAKDKILMGAERRSMVLSEEEKRLTAYHEAGHTIVGLSVPEHDPVHKVSIIPRGRALGVTMYLPEEDRVSYSKRRLESQLASLFGGRVAEELIYGDDSVTTGASNDIKRATELATNMVKKWGLSSIVGPLAYAEEEGAGFLGQGHSEKSMAASTAEAIDAEIKALIQKNYAVSRKILKKHLDTLHRMAAALMEYETLDKAQILDIMAGRPLRGPGTGTDSSEPDVHDDPGTAGLSPAYFDGSATP
ncbi:MAG TPA: ATP-dependent metallopeptidase FtsH/Yme1/Tma family protein [Gammaproteobacteria bacterium]|nr:ATP-dependent metallopeptidase FtsH/Yme1/Tma family protein [Gammaproteobacteria bacterium]